MPVALKIFSPARYDDARGYDEAMARIAEIAAHVAQIQQDNLLDVHNFVDRNRIRIMEMEWIDGYDLARLMTAEMLDRTHARVSNRRWEQLNDVIVTAGPNQPRLKPGVAISVVRECLAALAALHREGIVHGDLKPSNIMLKRTGNAKIVDIGSAFELTNAPVQRTCTPSYAAPEVLDRGECSPRSDLASLGYVLIEILAGRPVFAWPAHLSRTAGSQAFIGQGPAQHPAARSGVQRAADEFLPRADRFRSHAPFSQRRGRGPGQGGGRQLPSPTDQGRPGQRIRKRNSAVARRA